MRIQMGAQRCKRYYVNNKDIREESDSWRTSCSSNGKESAGDQGSIPGLGRSTGEENGNPLQYSWLENSIHREAWRLQFVRSQRVRHDWVIHTHTHRHTHTVGGLLRSGDYQANGGRHGEENMFVAALSLHPKKLGRQVRSVWKIWCGICHGIWQQFFSCLPTTFNNGFGIPFLYRTIQIY